MALEIGARGRPLYNVVISNVPGPPIPLYMGGAELQNNYPISVITDGAGLNITVLSYRGSMDFGVIADPDQMPDAENDHGRPAQRARRARDRLRDLDDLGQRLGRNPEL